MKIKKSISCEFDIKYLERQNKNQHKPLTLKIKNSVNGESLQNCDNVNVSYNIRKTKSCLEMQTSTSSLEPLRNNGECVSNIESYPLRERKYFINDINDITKPVKKLESCSIELKHRSNDLKKCEITSESSVIQQADSLASGTDNISTSVIVDCCGAKKSTGAGVIFCCLNHYCDRENIRCKKIKMALHCRGCVSLFVSCCGKLFYFLAVVVFLSVRASEIVSMRQLQGRQGSVSLGSCILVLSRTCPDPDVNFFLYTRSNPTYPQPVEVGDSLITSNISSTDFDPSLPTKIIIHGYNSDMFLNALVEIKKQYLQRGSYNIFAVDWAKLAAAPCYPSAVINSYHVGACVAQLVERLRDLNADDLHLIGFSLGAHVSGFAANNLRPYLLPRITGLDPAMPGFTFVNRDRKLDPTDAEFVDVFHTNAFIQGKIEPSGDVDFYINGGVIQPGCWAEQRFFACNHHRAPLYFAESINSNLGFWGWPCRNFFMYLIGLCPPREPQILAGEFVNKTARGFHLVITGSVAPFAVGQFTGPTIEIIKKNMDKQRLLYTERVLMSTEQYRNEIISGTSEDDLFEWFTPSVSLVS